MNNTKYDTNYTSYHDLSGRYRMDDHLSSLLIGDELAEILEREYDRPRLKALLLAREVAGRMGRDGCRIITLLGDDLCYVYGRRDILYHAKHPGSDEALIINYGGIVP